MGWIPHVCVCVCTLGVHVSIHKSGQRREGKRVCVCVRARKRACCVCVQERHREEVKQKEGIWGGVGGRKWKKKRKKEKESISFWRRTEFTNYLSFNPQRILHGAALELFANGFESCSREKKKKPKAIRRIKKKVWEREHIWNLRRPSCFVVFFYIFFLTFHLEGPFKYRLHLDRPNKRAFKNQVC